MIKQDVLYVETYEIDNFEVYSQVSTKLKHIPSRFLYAYNIIIVKNLKTADFIILKNRYGMVGMWNSYKNTIKQLKIDVFNTKKRKKNRIVGPYTTELVNLQFVDAMELKRKLLDIRAQHTTV